MGMQKLNLPLAYEQEKKFIMNGYVFGQKKIEFSYQQKDFD